MNRREYTAEEATARGLDQWRSDPEMTIADLHARLRMLEEAVSQLQLQLLKRV